MTDQAVIPAILILTLITIVATVLTVGMVLEQLLRSFNGWLPRLIDHAKSPDAGDRLVGLIIVICAVVFLISDYANDWPGAL